jgi:putative membrane-bound dehydrogenase-like protein
VRQIFIPLTAVACCLFAFRPAPAADQYLHQFQRIKLTGTYYAEGANYGDINGDGKMDVVYGPYWFEGPDFKKKHEIYPAKPQNMNFYADHFFAWVYDFNGDGKPDVFTVGFPGTPAYVYENPGKGNYGKLWKRHQVFDWVSNESPQFTNIVGDERPELICTRHGAFGYATIDWKQPFKPWTFHAISAKVATDRFGHGLGVGDIDGDGKMDVIASNGWYQQPKSLEGDPPWKFHPYTFTRAGGADMFAYDVNGDGKNDVITSLQAHSFGLAWFEQVREGGKITFKKHLIMGSKPSENKYGVVFSELHSVNLVDMDGDGLKDIVTGKTYWSHHKQAPQWDAGAVVYWFKLVRTKKGVDWVPYKADGEAGIGRQVTVGDINGDKLPDIVVGGMKGCNVLIHKKVPVSKAAFDAAQPQGPKPMKAGLQPKEAAANMTVPPGFRVQLAAGEPTVHQPIGFTIDHKGRLWIAEAYTYPRRAPEGKGKDRIIILEDKDGDGVFETRKVFIEGLNLVSGIQVGFGGVWVGAAPYLMFIPDKDGDDKPDPPVKGWKPQAGLRYPKDVPPGATVLLDGFGWHDTHETLNAFIWGPDGWLYGCHGVFTYSRVGKPGTPDDQRTPLNAGVWRYHPTKRTFEVFAWGSSNPWGVDFNDNGQAFITACVIPHLYHVIQGARYQRQGGRHFNPYVYDDIKTIADHLHYVGNIRDHAWWGHEPNAPAPTLAAGGGHAHCGAMLYLGDNWPDSYRNKIYMNNIHGNRVNCDVLVRSGSGFIGKHGRDQLIANDHWFRGINLKYGPDGSVYLIDWYDKNACHRTNPLIWDRTNGRVYNIAYGERKPKRVQVDLSKLSDAELIKLQTHKNDWYVRMARRLLQERAAVGKRIAGTKDLWSTISRDAHVPRKLRALWTLHVTGNLTSEQLRELMKEPNEFVRAWAIQLELEDRQAPPETVKVLAELAKTDISPVVRLYVAAAAQRLPGKDRWPLLEGLASHAEDAKDHNIPLMTWYALEPVVTAEPERALRLATESKIPLLTRFILRRAASDNKTLDSVMAFLTKETNAKKQLLILEELLAAFEGRVNIPMPDSWTPAYGKLSKSDNADIRDRADEVAVVLGDKRILPRMRQVLADSRQPLKKRQQALDILIKGRDKDAAPAFQAAIGNESLRGKAIRALAAYSHPATPKVVLAEYKKLSDDEKRDAVSTLTARPDYALALLSAVKSGTVPRTDLHAYHIRQLLGFKNAELERQIKDVWGNIRETSADKKKQIAALKLQLTPWRLRSGDRSNGRRLFAKTCAACHTLFGEGGKVGPDITGSNRANLDYILNNVVDPSAVLAKDYRMWIFALSSGRVVSGLIKKETDSAYTVRTINDTVVLAKTDIEQHKISKLSIMPEKLLDNLKPNEVRDLIAYVGSPTQVALRGPRSPIDRKTGKVPGAIEGESMKIVGKTAGSAASQSMSPFRADRWSGNDQLWWTGARRGAKLDLELPVKTTGRYELQLVLTKARDYAIVELSLDGKSLSGPIDLYNSPEVITTGVLSFDTPELKAGKHKLTIKIVGANRRAVKAYMVGLDYVRLQPPAAKNTARRAQ